MDLDRFQYLILMGLCLAITLPLELVLGARVWRRPKRLVKSLAVPVLLFMTWDWVAVARGHWDYNPRYVTGWALPGNLPVEELVFFLVIPICCLLTLEAVGRVLRGEVRLPWRRSGE
ncbi:MAG TPA: lycopene cyclase domain-containing protein [Acidimicrobiales bacterium]|nr:lycopene cyclase domain-containing protein [Acidimicrobiales bacterium]